MVTAVLFFSFIFSVFFHLALMATFFLRTNTDGHFKYLMSSINKRPNNKSSNDRRQHCKILQEKVNEQDFYRRITKFSNRNKSQMEHTYIKCFFRTYLYNYFMYSVF